MRKWLRFLNHVREDTTITVLFSSHMIIDYANCQCKCHPSTLPGDTETKDWDFDPAFEDGQLVALIWVLELLAFL